MDTHNQETNTNEKATPQKTKQPYHKPQLSIYGDIKTLTQAVGGNSTVDGGMTGMLKSF